MYYVYILECNDKSYYIGVTNNLERRVFEHNEGKVKGYTSQRKPVILKYYEEFTDINHAIAFEKQLKGWSRIKKEALINKNIKLLKTLSNRHGSSGSPRHINNYHGFLLLRLRQAGSP